MDLDEVGVKESILRGRRVRMRRGLWVGIGKWDTARKLDLRLTSIRVSPYTSPLRIDRLQRSR